MNGRDTVALNWKRPPEWDRFIETVKENHRGYSSPYAGLAIEQAWDESRTEHAVENYANRILDAAGLPRTQWDTHKPSSIPSTTDTGRATVRVLKEVKDEMAAFANESNVPKHAVLRSVVLWYLSGGTLGRLEGKLERATPDAVDALDDVAGTDTLPPTQKRTIEISKSVPKECTRDDLAAAIESVAGSDPRTIDQYISRVVERKDLIEHPNAPNLFIPREKAEQIKEREREEREREAREAAERKAKQLTHSEPAMSKPAPTVTAETAAPTAVDVSTDGGIDTGDRSNEEGEKSQ